MRQTRSILLLLFAAGCGGGVASTTSPSPAAAASPASAVSEPTPVTPATVSTANVTITYDGAVSSADRQLIERGTAIALGMFQARFGRTITGPVPMLVRAGDGPYVGHAQSHAIDFYLGHVGWTGVSSPVRTRTIVHEFFHILQEEVAWPLDPTQWFLEGTAEYVGYAAAFDAGLTSYSAIRNCEAQIYLNGGAPPPLEQVEFGLSSSVNSRYAVAWLAVDRLLGGFNGLAKLKGFWEAGGAWEQRFQTAFGISPAAFYADFNAFRPSPPPANACAAL